MSGTPKPPDARTLTPNAYRAAREKMKRDAIAAELKRIDAAAWSRLARKRDGGKR